jgi:hypothetical protein
MPRLTRGAGLARGVAIFALFSSLPAAAKKATEARNWFEALKLEGFVSGSYTWNFNDPASRNNLYRVYDFDHNSFTLEVAELILEQKAIEPGDFGFRIIFTAGSAVPRVTAARGLFRDPKTGVGGDFDLQQAYGSYIVPVGHGLRIDAGKFATPVGYEYIDGYDGYNDNYSRSFLFNFGPYTHTGFKVTYAFHRKFQAGFMLTNGWDNVEDNNKAKSLGFMTSTFPTDKLSIYLNYLAGPERDNNDDDWRHFLDFGLVYKPHPFVTVGCNIAWGLDERAITLSNVPIGKPTTADAIWLGGAGYLRVQPLQRVAFNLRGEVFWDRDGYRSGTPQNLYEVTVTPEFRVTEQFIVRPEARIDISDPKDVCNNGTCVPGPRVFETATGHSHTQPTVAVNAIYLAP